jgi:hypothetical protein
MRRYSRFLLIQIFIIPALALSSTNASAEVTRTLEMEIGAGEGFAVENLAGEMRILPGAGGNVVVVATVHAESQRLADAIRLEEVSGKLSPRTLRVEYPLDLHTSYRFPEGGGNTSTRYAGRKVRVSRSSGVLLYVDLEIRLPGSEVDGKFRNVAGPVSGRDVAGTLTFDTGSGDVILSHVRGRINADTGSGDINATDVEGSFDGDTGSGDVKLTQFRGESITCDTGSGDIKITNSEADTIDADTGSGDVLVEESILRKLDADTGSGDIEVSGNGVELFDADTGSGSVELVTDGEQLMRVDVDTGSGSFVVRLGPNASFEALADQSSGTIKNRFSGAEAIIRGREVIGYRRGDGRTQIRSDTGSGNLILEPIR